jgi:putative lipoic acid-binding regulatory protein
MDYAQQGSKMPELQSKDEAVLKSFSNNIQEELSRQQKAIYEIEDKLHEVLNLRVPEKEEEKQLQKEASISDYHSFLIQQLNIISKNNARLEKIRQHLFKII